jgi:hypothetical protein
MIEQDIQTKIKKSLKKNGWLTRKIITCSDSGWPDLEAFRNGVNVHIEVKKPGKNPSDIQLLRHSQLRKQGFEVIVATSIKDIEHLFLAPPC